MNKGTKVQVKTPKAHCTGVVISVEQDGHCLVAVDISDSQLRLVIYCAPDEMTAIVEKGLK